MGTFVYFEDFEPFEGFTEGVIENEDDDDYGSKEAEPVDDYINGEEGQLTDMDYEPSEW